MTWVICLTGGRLLKTLDESRLPGETLEGPHLNPEPYCMKGFLNYFGMSVGGWIGWAIGAQLSIFTAFMVSMVGTAVGLYSTRRLIRRRLP